MWDVNVKGSTTSPMSLFPISLSVSPDLLNGVIEQGREIRCLKPASLSQFDVLILCAKQWFHPRGSG